MLPRAAAYFTAAALFWIWGCASPIRVEENSADRRRSYGVADYSAGVLSSKTANLLGDFMLTELYEKSPGEVLIRLENLYKQEKQPAFIAALADAALQTGYKVRKNSDLSSRYFLASAVSSFFYLKQLDDIRDPYCEQRIRMMRIYNLAMTELFFYLKKQGLERRSGFELPMPGMGERQVRFRKPVYELPVGEQWIADFTPCAHYRTLGLTHDTRVFGVGVPLVAELKEGVRDVGGKMISGLPIAVTLAGSFEIDPASGAITGELRYIYSRFTDKVTFGNRVLPLAGDFSTPLAGAVGKPQDMNFLERTIKVAEAERITGLYHLEPYDDKRIPVVFVHGLMSDARTWSQMLNTLLHDPVIRDRYQFLGFAYSSGNPIFVSAANLRRELRALREQLVKQKRSTAAFDKMVLVGHSMGGLLSRLQITGSSEAELMKALQIRETETLKSKLEPSEKQRFESLFNFEPSPFVRRVIFIAVPHRGSEVATGWLAGVGASLIRLPANLVKRNVQIISEVAGLERLAEALKKTGTGIDNLRPDDVALNYLNKLVIAPDVPFHSIIGNRKSQGTPGGSDGIVPYSSSHLDGAASELVVKSGHSVQQNKLAIQEVRRILLKHAEETAGGNK
ncbi:MAG: alpha/beta fold hydrolase [Lentisphaeria bacterium]|nr:alpha/beta fold hydrolase [Lentisphaeria bacterium]